jgi:hypothetical protein
VFERSDTFTLISVSQYYANPTKPVDPVQSIHHHLNEYDLFSPWHSWKFSHFDITKQSLTLSITKRKFFLQNLTLDYMTKSLNQIIFFFLHQNQNIFFSNIGNQNIFLEKNHNPPPFKLNGRSLTNCKQNDSVPSPSRISHVCNLILIVLYTAVSYISGSAVSYMCGAR